MKSNEFKHIIRILVKDSYSLFMKWNYVKSKHYISHGYHIMLCCNARGCLCA